MSIQKLNVEKNDINSTVWHIYILLFIINLF